MRRFLLAVFALALPALAGNAAQAEPLPKKKYNVLFIVADDLHTSLGCYGHALVKTPHLDALAKRGLLFERAYCQFPLDNPSRASFLTGLRCDRTSVLENVTGLRQKLPSVITLPQMYKRQGYSVARVGQLFYANVPRDIGGSGLDDAASWQKAINPRGRDKDEEDKIHTLDSRKTLGGTLSWLAADGADEEQTDGQVATQAVKLLQEYREKPFFLGVGFNRPHTPFVAPKKYFDMYPLDKIPAPKAPVDDWADIPIMARPPRFDENPTDERVQREIIQAYYASISFLDAQVGKVVAAVDQLGLADKTIIVFLSDHGYHLGEHGLWQKQTLFEEAVRVPLLVSVPGMKTAGKSTGAVVELLDLYPTLVGLCGFKLPDDGVDGTSFVPLLENTQAPWNGVAVSEVLRPAPTGFAPSRGYSVRTQRWRLTMWENGIKGLELYDHERDPREMSNLARNPRYSDVVDFHLKILQNVTAPKN